MQLSGCFEINAQFEGIINGGTDKLSVISPIFVWHGFCGNNIAMMFSYLTFRCIFFLASIINIKIGRDTPL